MPCLRSGSLGFLRHIRGWLPVNVDAVRGQAGGDRFKVDPPPQAATIESRAARLCVKEALDFHVKSHL